MDVLNPTFWTLLLLIVVFPLWSQSDTPSLPPNSLLLSDAKAPAAIQLNKNLLALRFTSKSTIFPALRQSMVIPTKSNLPSAYCAADLAFFCRLEVQMEKATKIPVRFRLGDVQQVDYLEGKYEGWRYGH